MQCDARLRLLRVKWKKDGSASHFRDTYTQLLDLAEQLNSCRVLCELEEQPDISVYDQLWIGSYLIPRLLPLPLERLVICMSSARVYNQQVVESILDAAPASFTARCDVQLFTQPLAALQWLTDNSPLLPEVLAEWPYNRFRR
ncbi:MAG: hypothetical protein ACRYFX_22575 [Janthinobacterium lividum]